MQNRLIFPYIQRDLRKKIVLLSGPRQVGKTTLAKALTRTHEYLNYDAVSDRQTIRAQAWKRDTELLILDELHKMKKWKGWLKGIYDTEKGKPPILVTGSSRLDIAKKMGDSLAGRHFSFRLHPLTMRELKGSAPAEQTMNRLLSQGGFPEPFFATEKYFYERWQRSHLDLILRQDLLDLESVRRISDIETLIELLRYRVGSPISYQSLAEDLDVDISTIKRWLTILENLFVIFRVVPWTKNIARSLKKAAKFYFFDNGQVAGDEGAKFENLIAHELLSAVHLAQDIKGSRVSLHYLRDKDGHEIDFAVVDRNRVLSMIEAKWSDDRPGKDFIHLRPQGETPHAVQIVAKLSREKDYPFGVKVVSAAKWLENLEF